MPKQMDRGPFCIESISYTDQPGAASRDYTARQARPRAAVTRTSSHWRIDRSEETLNTSPYWVMRVDREPAVPIGPTSSTTT